jgi:hypothetical protein
MGSDDMAESSGSESDIPLTLYRTDGFWYVAPYEVLQNFACRLKGEALASSTVPLPVELCEVIGKFTKSNVSDSEQRIKIAKQASAYILSTLKERMDELQKIHKECVHSADHPYMNVIKYFGALKGYEFLKELMQAENKYLLDNVLPWLGLTHWQCTTGGRTRQLNTFKYRLKKFLKVKFPRPLGRGLKRSSALPASALESSALESPALESSALESTLPAPESVLPASALPLPLSQHELRVKRAAHFGFKLSEEDKKGGKRATTKKPRRVRKCKTVKKSKRRCKK